MTLREFNELCRRFDPYGDMSDDFTEYERHAAERERITELAQGDDDRMAIYAEWVLHWYHQHPAPTFPAIDDQLSLF